MILAYSQAVSIALTVIAGVLALALGAGLLAGQFRKGVVQELRESLETANTEIAIERGRSDRLDEELKQVNEQLTELKNRLASLENENRILRETLQSGVALSPDIQAAMSVAAADIAAKAEATAGILAAKLEASNAQWQITITKILEDGWKRHEAVDEAEFSKFEQRVIDRHAIFIDHLPPEVSDALKESLKPLK